MLYPTHPRRPQVSYARDGGQVEVASGDITLGDVVAVQGFEPRIGDLSVAYIAYRSNAAFTLPAGWSLVSAQQSAGNTTVGTAASQSSGLIAYIVRGASAPSLTFTRTAGDVAIGRTICFRHSSGIPFAYDAGSDFVQTVASTAAVTGTFDTTGTNELVVFFGAIARNSAFDTGITAAIEPGINSGLVAPGAVGTLTPGQWTFTPQAGTSTGADARITFAMGIKVRPGPTGQISGDHSLATCLDVGVGGAFKVIGQ